MRRLPELSISLASSCTLLTGSMKAEHLDPAIQGIDDEDAVIMIDGKPCG
jgi:hypothetical protein